MGVVYIHRDNHVFLGSNRIYMGGYSMSYETIEVRRKKRDWYLIGIVIGFILGFLVREVLS